MSETSLQTILVTGLRQFTSPVQMDEVCEEFVGTNMVLLGGRECFTVSTRLANGPFVIRLNTKRLSERMRFREANELLQRRGDGE